MPSSPLPSSPLLPYTTLFRSLLVPRPPTRDGPRRDLGKGGREHRHCDHGDLRPALLPCGPEPCRGGEAGVERDVDHRDRNADVQDRKSTRLNSSHRCISYAVFAATVISALALHDALPISTRSPASYSRWPSPRSWEGGS